MPIPFIGKHTLLVEGPSDILYLQALSAALRSRGRTGLDPRWTLCPSGGIDKVQPFVSLFAGNGGKLDVAVLTDQGTGDKNKVEKLKRSDLLKAGRVYSIADFIGASEADIEDLFATEIYVEVLNGCYDLRDANIVTVDKLINADVNTTRAVKKAEALFRVMPPNIAEFDHFAPSMFLLRNPILLDGTTKAVMDTLDNAEKVFAKFNEMIS